MLHKMDLLTHTFRVTFPFPKLRGFTWCSASLVFKLLEVASLHLGPWMLTACSSPFVRVLSWPCACSTGSPGSPPAGTPRNLVARTASERQQRHYLAFSLPEEGQAFITVHLLPRETPGRPASARRHLELVYWPLPLGSDPH